jgi:hypothetical protein
LKYPFWHKQPVFHYHNLWYWLVPPGIIQHEKPPKDKFYDHKIISKTFFSMPLEKKVAFATFIKRHYMPHKYEKYKPSQEAVLGYFKNHNDKSYLSLKYENNKLISTMSTRPLKCYIENNEMDLYYVDFLCVHKKHRKKGYAPKIIYTHYVKHRDKHKNCIFLFKREGAKNAIVPLTNYYNYYFDIEKWPRKILFDEPEINSILIGKENFDLFHDVFKRLNKSKFKCIIFPYISHLQHLIKKKLVFVAVTMIYKQPFDFFIFRNSHTYYNKKRSLELIASFNETREPIFCLSFLSALDKIRNEIDCEKLFIENISNNNIIIKNILNRYSYKEKITTSYYFYNFAIRPFTSTDVLIID